MLLNKYFLLWLAAMVSVLLVSSGNSGADPSGVKKGKKVSLEYTGTLSDGTVFDSSSRHNTPLQFEVGSGAVIPGFNEAVMGMKVGDKKTFTIQPAVAYGEVNPNLIQKISRKKLPPNGTPQVGMSLIVGPPGQQMRARITEVQTDLITLDFNHPLAGKVLTFDIKLLEISE
ncbi:MAG: peptidylprolyl isomerase [Nitrospinota bacterium]|nr:peptidylprolyl isomerase [Nitrospinota bacterium]